MDRKELTPLRRGDQTLTLEKASGGSASGLRRRRIGGFTLIELMIVIAIIAVVAAIAIPGLLAAQRASSERNASASLKTLTVAQADFRGNDRDGNRVADFWTGDVFGLYGMIPVTGGGTSLPADTTDATNIIKLVEPGLAGADALSNLAGYGNVTVAASIANGSTKAGYLYRRFANEQVGAAVDSLLVDTDGGALYGAVHHRTRFAFMALPDGLSSGKLLFLVNADNTIWKYNLPAAYAPTYTPLGSGESTSTVTGTGQALLDNATTFPQSPATLGCSKMD